MHTFLLTTLISAVASVQAAPTARSIGTPPELSVHNITRFAPLKFENLAIRSNGQILTTTTYPNASIYQVDPLNILPPTLIYNISGNVSATGIVEGKPDIFYVASSHVNLQNPLDIQPDTHAITEINMHGVFVHPNGSLSKMPTTKMVAKLPDAWLLNGITFARPHSDNLLVADSFRGLIWNVNTCTGDIGVTLNDTTTKGAAPAFGSPLFTGVNGLKVHDGSLYWTSTGAKRMYSIPIDESGNVREGDTPKLFADNLGCDDFTFDRAGNAYVASPLDQITKITPAGEKEVIAGTFNSTQSSLVGPTAIRFGRLVSDQWSMYVTTNGGLSQMLPPLAEGVSRIDLA